MRACRHCGKENSDGLALCAECGLELGDSPFHRAALRAWERSSGFFRWRPASLLLIILAVLYGLFALLNLWMGRFSSVRGELQMAHSLYWGMFWNVVVAVLCMAGRQMMRRQTRVWLLAGALAVMVALFVVIRIWVSGLLRGHNPFPAIEALFIWVPLIYVILYAYRESRSERVK